MGTQPARPMHAMLAGLPDRLRLPLAFDPAALAADLATVAALAWTPHYVPDHYTGDWAVLPLRLPAGTAALHPILRAAADPGTAAWEDSDLLGKCPAFTAVLAALHCPLGAARLMRLTPGSVIHTHRDVDLAPEQGNARLHVPIATNPQVDFRLNGARVAMAAGETWYLRLADPHQVANRGTRDRVHLVIDAVVDAWLAGMLLSAAV